MVTDLHTAVDREHKLHLGRIELIDIAVVQLDRARRERICILIIDGLDHTARHALVGIRIRIRIVSPDRLGLRAVVNDRVLRRRGVERLFLHLSAVHENGRIVQAEGDDVVDLRAALRDLRAARRIIRHLEGVHLAVRIHLGVQHTRIDAAALLLCLQEVIEEIYAVRLRELGLRVAVADVLV